MQFSSTFKRLCKEKDVSQKKALEDMGMGRNAVQGWTKGSPSFETLQKIAAYFEVSIDELSENDQSGSFIGKAQSAVVFQSTATNNSVQIGGETLTEQEKEMLSIFRKLDRRSRLDVMAVLYEMEDKLAV